MQVELFLSAISKEDAVKMRNDMLASRSANTDNNAFKKMLRGLENG